MIGRIVVTSVPDGLGGIAGFQPVWRTAGLPSPIAQRMAARATYSHPLPPGDAGNPVVFFHRIETVGSRTFHLIGSARDAGSDYSGRSNYLAEVIALAPEETEGLPGGPVFLASRFPWLERWAGAPREASLDEEPQLRGSEDPPGFCKAWERATGDAGWAGHLAQAFLDGRRAFLWTPRSGDSDHRETLELFREAASLLPPSQRWTLTFNSCEIEPFPVLWRGVRADLPVVGPRPTVHDFNRDLDGLRKSGERAPDGPLASIARGQAAERPPTIPLGNRPSPSGSSGFGKAIDDSRRVPGNRNRRSERIRPGSKVTAFDPSSGPTDPGRRHHWLLPVIALTASFAVVAVVGTVALYASHNPGRLIAVFPQLARTDGPRPRLPELGDSGLRRAEAEPAKEKPEEEQKTKETAESTDDLRKKDAEPARDKKKKEPQEADEARSRDEEMAKSEHMIRLQKAAITDLEGTQGSPGDRSVSLLPAAVKRHDPSGPLLEPVKLCPFDIKNLVNPTLDLACVLPPGDPGRLIIEPEAGRTGVWAVRGQLYDPNDVTLEPKPQRIVCRFVARDDGHLYLEWPKGNEPRLEPKSSLFSRLEYSVLLISSAAPGPPGSSPVLRREIRMVEPIPLAPEIPLDPLAGNPVGSRVDIPLESAETQERLVDRLANAIPDSDESRETWMRWKIRLSHPQCEEKNQTLCSPHKEVEFKSPKIPLTYHSRPDATDKDATDKWESKSVPLEFSFQIEFDPETAKFSAVPNLPDTKTADPVLKSFTSQTVEKYRATGDRLEKDLVKALSEMPDPSIAKDRYERDDALFRLAQLEKKKPGTLSNPGFTRKNTGDWNSEYEKQNQRLGACNRNITSRQGMNEIKYKEDVNTILEELKKFPKLFDPVTAKILLLQVIARDAEGKEYPIDIVPRMERN